MKKSLLIASLCLLSIAGKAQFRNMTICSIRVTGICYDPTSSSCTTTPGTSVVVPPPATPGGPLTLVPFSSVYCSSGQTLVGYNVSWVGGTCSIDVDANSSAFPTCASGWSFTDAIVHPATLADCNAPACVTPFPGYSDEMDIILSSSDMSFLPG